MYFSRYHVISTLLMIQHRFIISVSRYTISLILLTFPLIAQETSSIILGQLSNQESVLTPSIIAYENNLYKEAIKDTEKLITDLKLNTLKSILLAHQILGPVSYTHLTLPTNREV